jgi:hypothetical protein
MKKNRLKKKVDVEEDEDYEDDEDVEEEIPKPPKPKKSGEWEVAQVATQTEEVVVESGGEEPLSDAQWRAKVLNDLEEIKKGVL